jgi:hypothetical protein
MRIDTLGNAHLISETSSEHFFFCHQYAFFGCVKMKYYNFLANGKQDLGFLNNMPIRGILVSQDMYDRKLVDILFCTCTNNY